MAIQQRLKQLGYYKGVLDSLYEDDMKSALHRFQKENGIKMNNTITKKTWYVINVIKLRQV